MKNVWIFISYCFVLLLSPLSAANENVVSIAVQVDTQEQEQEPDSDAVKEADPVDVEDFFRRQSITKVSLNPRSGLIAYIRNQQIYVGSKDKPFNILQRANLQQSQTRLKQSDLAALFMRVSDVQWIGENKLIASSHRNFFDANNFYIYEVEWQDDAFKVVDQDSFNATGYIIDPMLEQDNAIMFGRYIVTDEKSYTNAFAVDLTKSVVGQLNKRLRLNKRNTKVKHWGTNNDHKLSYGVGYDDGKPQLWRYSRRDGKWRNVWTAESDIAFSPVGTAPDNKSLWVLTDFQSDKVYAAEFDLESLTISKPIYANDDYDVRGIIFDENQMLAGVTYLQDGLLTYHYLNGAHEQKLSAIQAQFPQQEAIMLDANDNLSKVVVYTSSATNAGTIHQCYLDAEYTCQQIERVRPWLNDVVFAESSVLRSISTDGLEIESYFTQPVSGDASYPLIVMPHGGPVGVQDNRHFDAHVQWLAFNGYAVLQVNYRGSSGYGKAFQKSGMQEWGRGIENDIDAAVENLLSMPDARINRDSLCVFGGSYGGYSALMSIIRFPEKYKCAASVAGVMDLTLLFNKGSIKSNQALTEVLKELVGDPVAQQQELMQYSPVYRYKDISLPVYLAHGTADYVADVEHSWRMAKMLKLADAEHELHIMSGVEHSFDTTDEVKDFYDTLMPFLDKHLKPQSSHTEAQQTSAP